MRAWIMENSKIRIGDIPDSEVRFIRIYKNKVFFSVMGAYDQATAEKLVKIGAYQNPDYDYEIVTKAEVEKTREIQK